jgi:hypothetical protein
MSWFRLRVVKRVLSFAACMSVAGLTMGSIAAGARSERAPTLAAGHAHQRAAQHEARTALGSVVLPAGSTQVDSEPAGSQQLDRPFAALYFLDQVDLTRFWTTSASPQQVVASFDAHRAPAWRQHESGYGGSIAFSSYSLPASTATGGGVGEVALSATPLEGGGTGVRADVEVQYTAPHPPAAKVPTSARVLEVREYRWAYPAHPGLRSREGRQVLHHLVRSGPAVREVAAAVDSLPLAGHDRGVAFSCPAESSNTPTIELTFRARRGGPSLAFVSLSGVTPAEVSPCFAAQFVVHHHPQPGLYDGGLLLRRTGHLLGVRLISR